jgi:hypothetical protein
MIAQVTLHLWFGHTDVMDQGEGAAYQNETKDNEMDDGD